MGTGNPHQSSVPLRVRVPHQIDRFGRNKRICFFSQRIFQLFASDFLLLQTRDVLDCLKNTLEGIGTVEYRETAL
jgi:hypothetical protein